MDKTTQIIFLEEYTRNGYSHFSDNVFSISKNFKRLGSFWTTQLPKETRDQAKTLSSIALYTNTISNIENTKYNFLNKPEYLYETNGVFDLTKVYNFPTEDEIPDTPSTEPLILNVWNKDLETLVPGLTVTIVGIEDENNNITLDIKPSEMALQTAMLSNTTEEVTSIDVSITNGIRFTKIYTDPEEQFKEWIPPILYNGIDFYQDKGVLKITNAKCLKYKDNNLTLNLTLKNIFENKKLFYSGYISEFAAKGQSLFNSLIGVNNIASSPQEYYVANYINGSKQSIKDFERMINVSLGRVCMYGHKKAKLIKIVNNKFIFEDISNAETLTERENNVINNTSDTDKQQILINAYNTFILKQTADSINADLPLFPSLTEENKNIFFEDDLVQPVVKIMYNKADDANWWDKYTDPQLPAQEISTAWNSGIFNNTTKNETAANTVDGCRNIVKTRPTTLFIYINWVLLNSIWTQNTQVSRYWDNKYPSITYLLQDIVNIVKAYAPLGTLPLILITDMNSDSETSEPTIKDINLSNLLN